MKNYIPEKQYQEIIKLIPIFCIDFLVRNNDEILLIKRKEEPLKDIYWFPGGRLRLNENINECAFRIQKNEIGKIFKDFKLVGFSNYFFDNVENSRAIHTPTLLYEIKVNEKFIPILDKKHDNYIWTLDLPKEFKREQKFYKFNFFDM
tara:strand:+ start:302 stop:745 length:444 start_codon:yes stop_codon:yes gene_type:complete